MTAGGEKSKRRPAELSVPEYRAPPVKGGSASQPSLPGHGRRYLILAVSYVQVLLTAGVVFGWAALEPFYMDSSPGQRAMIFTAGASFNYLSNVFLGPYLDSRGCRSCSGLACTLMVLGAVGMGAAELPQVREASFAGGSPGQARLALVAVSFSLLGFAGPGVQIPTLKCELLFPDSAALVTSLSASLFDASCIVFLAFRLLAMSLGIGCQALWAGYAAILLGCLVAGQGLFGDLDAAQEHAAQQQIKEDEGMLTPKTPKTPQSPATHRNQRNSLAGDVALHSDPLSPIGRKVSPLKKQLLPIRTPIRPSFQEAVRSARFAYLVCFCAINILRLNFVVLSINTQMQMLFGEAQAPNLVLAFSVLLPLGGLAAPATGYLLQHHRSWAFRVNLALSFVYGLCLIVPSVPVQVLGFIIISVSRQLTYSIVFSFNIAFFGQEHLGKLLGMNNLVVCMISLAQYPIMSAVGGYWLPSWSSADLLMVAIAVPLLLSNGGIEDDGGD